MGSRPKFYVNYRYVQTPLDTFRVFVSLKFEIKKQHVLSFSVSLLQLRQTFKFNKSGGRLKKKGKYTDTLQSTKLPYNMLDGKYTVPLEYDVDQESINNDFYNVEHYVILKLVTMDYTIECTKQIFLYNQAEVEVFKHRNLSDKELKYKISFPKNVYLNMPMQVNVTLSVPQTFIVVILQKLTFSVVTDGEFVKTTEYELFQGNQKEVVIKNLGKQKMIQSFEAGSVRCEHQLELRFTKLKRRVAFPIEVLSRRLPSESFHNMLPLYDPGIV